MTYKSLYLKLKQDLKNGNVKIHESRVNSITAVSYTHLDVYKRQAHKVELMQLNISDKLNFHL